MRRLFFLLVLIAFAAPPALAKPLRFPHNGGYGFKLDLPQGWNTTTDKRGGLLLVPPDNHGLIYLAIVTDEKLRGDPERAVAGHVAKIAGIDMDDKQDTERITATDGVWVIRGTAFYGTLPAKHGLARRARIVLFKLAPDTWAQVWTVTQPGMNVRETAALAKVLNSISLTTQ
jgi:hypothetical protein